MLVPAPGDYSDTSFPRFPQTAYAWGFSFLRDPQIKTSIKFLFFFRKRTERALQQFVFKTPAHTSDYSNVSL